MLSTGSALNPINSDFYIAFEIYGNVRERERKMLYPEENF